MASDLHDTINKQVFKLSKLKTRSVTLYPSRAAVVRDIENVKIKPGRNEISIIGISSKVDENTIKVEGHGTRGLITDIVVEKVAYSIYAEFDEEQFEEEKDPVSEQLKEEIAELDGKLEDVQEKLKSCTSRLAFMDQHATNMSTLSQLTSSMADNLKVYAEFRENIYLEYKAAQAMSKELKKQHDRKTLDHKIACARWLDKTKEMRAQEQEEKGNRPYNVTKVTVTVELDSLPQKTESIESYVSTGKPARASDDEPPKSKGPSLRISYVTGEAGWKPRYDIRLDSTSETALLTYRAEFTNNTGETWTDAAVTLSTSQTSFTGLEDKVPWLDSWRMNLRKDAGAGGGSLAHELYSTKEKQMKRNLKRKRGKYDSDSLPFLRATSDALKKRRRRESEEEEEEEEEGLDEEDVEYLAQPAAPQAAYLFGSGAASFGTPINVPTGPNLPPPHQSQFKRLNTGERCRRVFLDIEAEVDSEEDEDNDDDDDDDDTIDIPRKMGLALSKSESYGLTTTYDLPGARTIPHSRRARRHVIKELTLPNVKFSHVSVPKLQAAAFLKAKITNSSSISLLQGPCGLTVDGSFLGNTTVGRCAPDSTFELSLGIDEEVLISYRTPVRKMASQGMLSREQVATYERSVRVHNSKRKKIEVLLFDQVPVSEDERLKIALLAPKVREVGLMSAVSVRSTGGKELTVDRLLKKGGEIRFVVSLDKGDSVVLPVEYEARFPIGEHITEVGYADDGGYISM
ncbi:hypothetical protein P167DRAFT_572644 [Morchella conica CCBAS932]|uniref:DUF4139 domain-containing protein n=1 Tax=Morchella conica CCBAS932 TaxID=1392247 RepID=A0A3N4KU37_9PEZI|nr:hypothetical protein P167DRAFT_572644 [Morchella conica CCBAS932]